VNNFFATMTRRCLLKSVAGASFFFGMPGLAYCSSVPKYQPTMTDSGKALHLVHGNVVDVIRGVILRDRNVTIRGGVIESVSEQIPVKREGDRVLDIQDQFIIPGLIDAHCHMTMSSESTLNPFLFLTTLRQLKRNFIQQVRQGVTTVRDLGAMPGLLHDYLKQIEQGELVGPRIVYCNAFTNILGGHPDIDPTHLGVFASLVMAYAGQLSLWFKNAQDLKQKMKQNSAAGASFIKLTLDNRSLLCGKGEIPVYSDEHLKIIIDYAQKNNLATAGHIHTKFGFDRARQWAIDSMEHMIADALLSEKEVSEMAKKKIAIVPTMVIAQMMAAEEAYSERPPEYRNDFIDREVAIRREYIAATHDDYVEPSIHQDNVASLENYKIHGGCDALYEKKVFMANPEIYFNMLLVGPRNLQAMREAGVIIGCGTDAGVPFQYHGTLWREMEMLCRLGFSATEVMRCATINNAKIVGLADKLGTVEVGKCADLAVLRENPLSRIEACRHPVLVIKEGAVYDPSKMKF